MNDSKTKEKTVKVLAGIGLIVVLVAAGWAGAKVIRFTPTALSNIASVFSNFVAKDEPEFIGPEMPNNDVEEEMNEPAPQYNTGTPVVGPTQTTVVEVPQLPNSNPFGTADLKITLLDTGIVDTSGTFVSINKIPKNKRAAIKFTVENIGDKESGSWGFSAVLPGVRTTKYTSDTQISLFPTQSIEFIIGFDRPSVGVENYSITVDPKDHIAELDESNNKIESTINVVN